MYSGKIPSKSPFPQEMSKEEQQMTNTIRINVFHLFCRTSTWPNSFREHERTRTHAHTHARTHTHTHTLQTGGQGTTRGFFFSCFSEKLKPRHICGAAGTLQGLNYGTKATLCSCYPRSRWGLSFKWLALYREFKGIFDLNPAKKKTKKKKPSIWYPSRVAVMQKIVPQYTHW